MSIAHRRKTRFFHGYYSTLVTFLRFNVFCLLNVFIIKTSVVKCNSKQLAIILHRLLRGFAFQSHVQIDGQRSVVSCNTGSTGSRNARKLRYFAHFKPLSVTRASLHPLGFDVLEFFLTIFTSKVQRALDRKGLSAGYTWQTARDGQCNLATTETDRQTDRGQERQTDR